MSSKSNQKNNKALNLLENNYFKILLAIWLVGIAIYFLPTILTGRVIEGDDFKYKSANDLFLSFQYLLGLWRDSSLLGSGGKAIFTVEKFIVILFPPFLSIFLVYILAILMVGVGAYKWARGLCFSKLSSGLSAGILSLSPVFFSYIRTGHIGKMHTVGFFFLSFALTTELFQLSRSKENLWKRGWMKLLLNSVFLSLGFLAGAFQTYLYIAGIYILYVVVLWFFYPLKDAGDREKEGIVVSSDERGSSTLKLRQPLRLIGLLILSGALALVLGVESVKRVMGEANGNEVSSSLIPIEEQVELTGSEEKSLTSEEEQKKWKENWLWATQWSLPKLETLDFFLPGVLGFLTNDPDNPYWGRVGQTAGWEQHRQGYRNYSLATNYLGIIFIIFLIYGLVKAPNKVRWFWGALVLLLLFLSWGKFFVVYRWFYALPYADQMRNPNKFILALYVPLGVLVMYGVDAYYQKIKHRFEESKTSLRNLEEKENLFYRLFLGGVGVLLLVWIFSLAQSSSWVAHFSKFYSSKESVLIVENIQLYLFRALVVWSIMTLLLHYLLKTKSQILFTYGLVIFLAVGWIDLYQVNEKYLKVVDFPQLDPDKEEDPIARFLLAKKAKTSQKVDGASEPFRIKDLRQGRYMNYFSWDISWRHNFSLLDPLVVRAGLAADYKAFFARLNRDLKYLRFSNVKYIVTPQMIKDPRISLVFHQKYSQVQEHIYIYELSESLPRVTLLNQYAEGNDVETILGGMNAPSFNPLKRAMVMAEVKENFSDLFSGIKGGDNKGVLTMELASDNEYRLKINLTSGQGNQILVLANHYNNDWVAKDQDGNQLVHFPVDYFLNGYVVTPSTKEVTLKYSMGWKQKIFVLFTLANYFILFLLLVYWVTCRLRGKHLK